MNALTVGGVLSCSVALLHVAIILWGASGYRYFGAGERMATLAEQGSPVPTLVTSGLVALFAVWAVCAFSAAGLVQKLPYLRAGLVAIGVVYTLRGLVLGPQVVWALSGNATAVPTRHLLFSTVSLVTGITYLWGTAQAWQSLAVGGAGGA